jgi:serine/threonine-protein kinase
MGMTPRRFGKYELVARLGEGRLGEVFLARQPGVRSVAVVKTVHPRLAATPDLVPALLEVAWLAAQVKHPNVVDLFDLGEEQGTAFLVMEYLAGASLAGVLRASPRGRLDRWSVAQVIADAAAGLHAIHELAGLNGQPLQMLHLDVSPGNLFVLHAGQAKLDDVGVARIRSADQALARQMSEYLAPEQYQGAAADRRSDVFSLGMVMWEALTHRRVYVAASDRERLAKARAGRVAPPSSVAPDVGKVLDDICLRALAREPADRHPTAAAMQEELLAALRGAGRAGDHKTIARFMRDTFASEIAAREELLREALGPDALSASGVRGRTTTMPPSAGGDAPPLPPRPRSSSSQPAMEAPPASRLSAAITTVDAPPAPPPSPTRPPPVPAAGRTLMMHRPSDPPPAGGGGVPASSGSHAVPPPVPPPRARATVPPPVPGAPTLMMTAPPRPPAPVTTPPPAASPPAAPVLPPIAAPALPPIAPPPSLGPIAPPAGPVAPLSPLRPVAQDAPTPVPPISLGSLKPLGQDAPTPVPPTPLPPPAPAASPAPTAFSSTSMPTLMVAPLAPVLSAPAAVATSPTTLVPPPPPAAVADDEPEEPELILEAEPAGEDEELTVESPPAIARTPTPVASPPAAPAAEAAAPPAVEPEPMVARTPTPVPPVAVAPLSAPTPAPAPPPSSSATIMRERTPVPPTPIPPPTSSGAATIMRERTPVPPTPIPPPTTSAPTLFAIPGGASASAKESEPGAAATVPLPMIRLAEMAEPPEGDAADEAARQRRMVTSGSFPVAAPAPWASAPFEGEFDEELGDDADPAAAGVAPAPLVAAPLPASPAARSRKLLVPLIAGGAAIAIVAVVLLTRGGGGSTSKRAADRPTTGTASGSVATGRAATGSSAGSGGSAGSQVAVATGSGTEAVATGTGSGSAVTAGGSGSEAGGSGSATTASGSGSGSEAVATGSGSATTASGSEAVATGSGTGSGSATTAAGSGSGSATTAAGSGSGSATTAAGSGSEAVASGSGSGSGSARVATAPTRKPGPTAAALYKQGQASFVIGNNVTALGQFQQAAHKDPRYAAAYKGMGLVYDRLGDRAKAAKAYRQYLKLSPRAKDAALIKARLEKLP